ncbi:MAG: hypothetical protein ACMUJM_05475 [bacterium]
MSKDKIRVQFDMSKESVEKLDNLCSKLSAPSRAQVVKMALGILHILVEEFKDKGVLYLERNGEKTQIIIPGITGT